MSDRYQTLADVYDALPQINCKGRCVEGCGVIPLYQVELESIKNQGLEPPTVIDSAKYGVLTCSQLSSDGKCSIHARRPLACRLFGVTKAMKCPYGCIPKRWLSEERSL